MNNNIDTEMNTINHLIDYLNSVSESRRIMNSIIDTLNHQENNIYNMILRREHSRTTNRGAHQTPYRTSPISRWWTQQPNFPQRINRFNFPSIHHNNGVSNYYDILRRFINSDYLDPVIIRPSSEQLSNATSIISIRDIPLSQRFYNVCPISYETFTDDTVVTRINHCRHYFDTNSINEWFNRNVICPVCRYDIRNIQQQSSENQDNFVNRSDTSTDTSANITDTQNTSSSNIHSSNISHNSSVPSRIVNNNIQNTRTVTSNSTNNHVGSSFYATTSDIANTNILDSLFSNLQHYISGNPSVIHLEYSLVPVDASSNLLDTNE